MFGEFKRDSTHIHCGVGRAETEILRVLNQNGEAYQSDIVRATGFSRGTVSEVLANLEERKMIRRMEVGRNSRILLTVGGGHHKGKTLRLGFTRAAEYPFLIPLRKTLEQESVKLEFQVYENGIGVARDLSLFRIDIGIAPVLTLFMFHSLDAPIKILGPAGSGGSSVVAGPKSPAGLEDAKAVCTKMSTMEMLMRTAMNQCVIPDTENLVYASGPTEMEAMVMSGSADICCIWEPYATILEARGARRLVRYSEISEHVCCAIAVGNHLGEALLSKFSKHYAASMERFKRDPESYFMSYAALSGLDSSLVRRVSAEYSYPVELSTDSIVRQFEGAGISLPSPSSFRNALYRE